MKVKMQMRIKLYHRRTDGSVKKWECWTDGAWVHSRWGVLGGKMTDSKEKGDRERWLKRVNHKKRKGWVVALDDVVESTNVDDVTFDFDVLPKSFAPAKPIKKVNIGEMMKWADLGLLLVQRKRDGMRHYIVSDSKARMRIYSSGKNDVTEHLQPLLAGFTMPPKTILDCELVCTTKKDNDQEGFLLVSGIARSLPERARVMIKRAENDGHDVALFAFDLLWENGKPIYKTKYEDRYRRLAKVIEEAYEKSINYRTRTSVIRMPLVAISPTRLATLSEAIDKVKKHKWEGLVLWRKDQATIVQVNGTPARANCWKLKPVQEEDIVALGYELGKGKNRNVVGKFKIAIVNGMDASGRPGFVPMGKCGTGLDDAQRKEALGWKYPCVIQIEYDAKSKKGFRFPVFKRKRDDKKPTDCVV